MTQLVLVAHSSPLVASKNAVRANSSRFIVVRGADALSCCRVAVISTVPSPTACTHPTGVTVATAVSLVVQVNRARTIGLPPAS